MSMKKYRVVRTFPGSLNRGDILRIDGSSYEYVKRLLGNMTKSNWCSEAELKEYPEFFEEIIEKDYEIIKIHYINPTVDQNRIITYKNDSCVECNDSNPKNICNLSSLTKTDWKYTTILKVKRLSDNVEFSVGDNTNNGIIKSFAEEGNMIRVYFNNKTNYHVNLNTLTPKSPIKLFTTFDGIDIYEGDSYFNLFIGGTLPLWEINQYTAIPILGEGLSKKCVFFSTREAAEEYISKFKSPVIDIHYNKLDLSDLLETLIPFKNKSVNIKVFKNNK